MKIKEIKRWLLEDVREFCIKHNFYTKGNNKAYSNMLNFVESKNPTTTNIYKVALDIMNHSDMNRLDLEGMEVTSFMFLLNKECIYTFYEEI